MSSKQSNKTSKKVTSSRSKSVSTKKPPVKSSKKTFWTTGKILIAALFALVIIPVFSSWYGNETSIRNTQASLVSYLEDKYDKQFTVERPHIEGSGLGMPGQWEANAYSVDDSKLQFVVGKDQDSDRFFDQYDDVIWKHEEAPKVEAQLRQLFDGVPFYSLTTNLKNNGGPDAIKGSIPSVDVAIKEYTDQFNYLLSVRFSVDTLKNEQTRQDIRTKFSTLNDYIKNKGISEPRLTFLISDTNENAGYRCSTSDIQRLGSFDKMLDHCLTTQDKRGVY